MKKILAIIPVLLLSACGTPSVEDLIEDPEMLAEIAQECLMLTAQGKDANTEECTNARKAQQQMARNMMNGIMNSMQH